MFILGKHIDYPICPRSANSEAICDIAGLQGMNRTKDSQFVDNGAPVDPFLDLGKFLAIYPGSFTGGNPSQGSSGKSEIRECISYLFVIVGTRPHIIWPYQMTPRREVLQRERNHAQGGGDHHD